LRLFWAQFKNCAEYNQWNKRQKLVYLRNSLEEDVANFLWDYGEKVTESLSSLTKTLKGALEEKLKQISTELKSETDEGRLRSHYRAST